MIVWLGIPDKKEIYDAIREFEYFDSSLNKIKEFNFAGMGLFRMMMGEEHKKYDLEHSIVRQLKEVEDILQSYNSEQDAENNYGNDQNKRWEDLCDDPSKIFTTDLLKIPLLSEEQFKFWLEIYQTIKEYAMLNSSPNPARSVATGAE